MKQGHFSLLITTFVLAGTHAVADSDIDNINSRTLKESRPTPSSARALRPFTDIPTTDSRPFTDIPTADSRPFTDIPTADSRPFTGTPTVIFSPTYTPSIAPSTGTPTGECGSLVDDFTIIGNGRCLDSDGDFHNLIRFDSIATGTECAEECDCVAGSLTLQGFDFDSSSSQCRCRVDEDNSGGALANVRDACGANGFNSNQGGTGKVISADGNSAFCCFRYDLTSSAPSGVPSPLLSARPSSAPSSKPSLQPTEECGPEIDDFSKMGVGRCLDSDGDVHNLIRFDSITSGTECAQECECVAESLTLQGFDFDPSSSQCRCRVDEDNSGNALFDTKNDCGANGFNTNNLGAGKVIRSNGNDGFCCFRYDLTTSVPSASPTEECGPEIDDFSKMGVGRCLDSDGDFHNLIRFDSITSGTECAEECECVAGSLTLQGFDFDSSSSQCRCRVDEDNSGGALANVRDACGANAFNSNQGGTDKVISADGNSAFCCFRYDLTSSVPSASPTLSFQPTGECGSIIDDYTNIGKGKCLDGDDTVHNLIRFNSIATGTDCAAQCDCVAQSLTLQGFDLDSSTNECRCRVDEDNSSGALTTARSTCSAQGQNASKGGSGKVISSDEDDDFCCFRYDLTTSAPSISPSSAPTFSSVPSASFSPSYTPSSAPTPRLLKTGKLCNAGTDCRSGCCGNVPNDGKGKVCVKLNDSNNNTCPYPDE